MLGNFVAARGLTVEISRYVVRTIVSDASLAALWNHELRWHRTIRGVQPAGSRIDSVSIAGATWDVWKGPMSGWTYIAYVRQTPADSVDLDLREFVHDALVRGTINPAWYLIDVEAGFEIWQGGSGLATRSFSAVVGGG